jgi:hypothetical protein
VHKLQPAIVYTAETVLPLLDAASEAFSTLSNEIEHILPVLNVALDEVRRSLNAEDWKRFCSEVLHTHPVHDFFLEDPFTKHSFTKPRGYPGDADLLDYIYGHKTPNTTALCLFLN